MSFSRHLAHAPRYILIGLLLLIFLSYVDYRVRKTNSAAVSQFLNKKESENHRESIKPNAALERRKFVAEESDEDEILPVLRTLHSINSLEQDDADEKKFQVGNETIPGKVVEPKSDTWKELVDDTHPFENQCRLLVTQANQEESQIQPVDSSSSQTKETKEEEKWIEVDEDGIIEVLSRTLNCSVVFLSGGLQSSNRSVSKTPATSLPTLTPLQINADCFVVQCSGPPNIRHEHAFRSLRDPSIPENKVSVAKSGNEIQNERAATQKPEARRRLSINMIGFESVARNALPLSSKEMEKLGFLFLHGFSNVAGNTPGNLLAMLAGEVPGEIDDVAIGDTDNSADAKAGCETLLNDNVAGTNRGVFNYPGIKALSGFSKQPTTHYYRASYLYKFQTEECDDITEDIALWRRYSELPKCHFGVSFFANLTASAVGRFDEALKEALESFAEKEGIDNSVLVVVGMLQNKTRELK